MSWLLGFLILHFLLSWHSRMVLKKMSVASVINKTGVD